MVLGVRVSGGENSEPCIWIFLRRGTRSDWERHLLSIWAASCILFTARRRERGQSSECQYLVIGGLHAVKGRRADLQNLRILANALAAQ